MLYSTSIVMTAWSISYLAHHPHPVRLQLLQLLDVHAGIPGYISIAGINITRDYQVTSIYRYRVDIHTKTLNIGKVIFDTLSLVVTGGYQRQRQKDKKGQGSREKKGRDFWGAKPDRWQMDGQMDLAFRPSFWQTDMALGPLFWQSSPLYQLSTLNPPFDNI